MQDLFVIDSHIAGDILAYKCHGTDHHVITDVNLIRDDAGARANTDVIAYNKRDWFLIDISASNANGCILPDPQRMAYHCGTIHNNPVMMGNHHARPDLRTQLDLSPIFENKFSVYLCGSLSQKFAV